MTQDEYQAEARRTAERTPDAYPEAIRKASLEVQHLWDLMVWTAGLVGEAGEVADYIKKVMGHGKPFDREKMVKELGDVRWYLSAIADFFGITDEEVCQANVAKLRARYPNGFTVEASAARVDEVKP